VLLRLGGGATRRETVERLCGGVLRLRGGGPEAAAAGELLSPALQVLDRYAPSRQQAPVQRGVLKQPRLSGFKKPKKGEKHSSHDERAAKKVRSLKLGDAPWRFQSELNLEGDLGWYNGRQIEVRKRTKEGNHVLSVGYVGSVKSRQAEEQRFAASKQQQEGLWEREAAVRELRQRIAAAEGSPAPALGTAPSRTLEQLKNSLARRERELVRYKDALDGTSVWKNLTAHTVPMWLRNLSAYDPIESDHLVYKNLERTRKIVFNPSLASTASAEELQALQTFFMEKGLVPHVQHVILHSAGVKPLVLLGTIGGGKHVWRGDAHWNPFGKRFSAGVRTCSVALTHSHSLSLALSPSRSFVLSLSRSLALSPARSLCLHSLPRSLSRALCVIMMKDCWASAPVQQYLRRCRVVVKALQSSSYGVARF
jgi:hypothetical protein